MRFVICCDDRRKSNFKLLPADIHKYIYLQIQIQTYVYIVYEMTKSYERY